MDQMKVEILQNNNNNNNQGSQSLTRVPQFGQRSPGYSSLPALVPLVVLLLVFCCCCCCFLTWGYFKHSFNLYIPGFYNLQIVKMLSSTGILVNFDVREAWGPFFYALIFFWTRKLCFAKSKWNSNLKRSEFRLQLRTLKFSSSSPT